MWVTSVAPLPSSSSSGLSNGRHQQKAGGREERGWGIYPLLVTLGWLLGVLAPVRRTPPYNPFSSGSTAVPFLPPPGREMGLLECSCDSKYLFVKLTSVLKLGVQPASAARQALFRELSSPNLHGDPVNDDHSPFMGEAPGAQRGQVTSSRSHS